MVAATKVQIEIFNWFVLTVHILLMLILNKGVSPRLPRFLVMNHPDGLDRSIRVEFASQLGLRSVVIDPGHKKCLELVLSRLGVSCGVPQGDLLLQFVSYLFFFVALFTRDPAKEVSGK